MHSLNRAQTESLLKIHQLKMDSFSLNTLNKYINNYKHDIILKLSTEKLTDKNISSQANLVNMVLDYSPKTKSTFQFTEKIDISKFREKHQVAKKSNKPSFSENSINNIKYRNEESYDKKIVKKKKIKIQYQKNQVEVPMKII